jgi:hypothetical protein
MADRPDEPNKPDSESVSLAKSTGDLIVPELLQAVKQEGAHVDVNFLLVQVIQKTPDPGEMVERTKEMMALAQNYEQQRVENFRTMADAIIDVKQRDPDEQEKRRNNRMRRCLKGVVGGCAVTCLGGGILGVATSANIVLTALLVAAGAIALAMSGPLAAGESISPNDVVRIVGALRWMKPGRYEPGSDEEGEEEPPKRRRRK